MNQTETRILKEDLNDRLKKVGCYIRNKRLAAGLSQSSLAELSGVGAHMNIARYENGSARIPSENLAPLAKALRCDLLEFTKLALPLYGLDFLSRLLPAKKKKSKN